MDYGCIYIHHHTFTLYTHSWDFISIKCEFFNYIKQCLLFVGALVPNQIDDTWRMFHDRKNVDWERVYIKSVLQFKFEVKKP